MNAQMLPNIVIGLAVIAWVISRQLSTRQVNEGRLYALPLILCGVGVAQGNLVDSAHQAVSVALLAVEALAAVVFGAWRAWTMRVWRDQSGALWRKGTPVTLAAWIMSFAVRIGLIAVGAQQGITSGSGGILVFIGLTLLVQNGIVAWRARELPGVAQATFSR